MRRVRYGSTGGPLFLEEAPVPEPGPDELLVHCEAIGATLPVVRKVAEAAEPIPLGGEIAGEVMAVGSGGSRFRVGDRVTGLCFGHGYADFALLHEVMASPSRTTPARSTRSPWSAAAWSRWAPSPPPGPNRARRPSSPPRRAGSATSPYSSRGHAARPASWVPCPTPRSPTS